MRNYSYLGPYIDVSALQLTNIVKKTATYCEQENCKSFKKPRTAADRFCADCGALLLKTESESVVNTAFDWFRVSIEQNLGERLTQVSVGTLQILILNQKINGVHAQWTDMGLVVDLIEKSAVGEMIQIFEKECVRELNVLQTFFKTPVPIKYGVVAGYE